MAAISAAATLPEPVKRYMVVYAFFGHKTFCLMRPL